MECAASKDPATYGLKPEDWNHGAVLQRQMRRVRIVAPLRPALTAWRSI